MRAAGLLQTGLRLIYPPTCMTCDALIADDRGLCGACWRETPFVGGVVCDGCGAPLAGQGGAAGDLCDDCLRVDRPWTAGRTTLIYAGNARKIVLGLKHGDRIDHAGPAARWMAQAGRDIVQTGMIVTAIPLHWRRRISRRYNQSVLLGRDVARHLGLEFCPDLLIRPVATPMLEHAGAEERFRILSHAIRPHPGRAERITGRDVLVIDDVMTSGATLCAATQALIAAGAASVRVLTLARAVKDA